MPTKLIIRAGLVILFFVIIVKSIGWGLELRIDKTVDVELYVYNANEDVVESKVYTVEDIEKIKLTDLLTEHAECTLDMHWGQEYILSWNGYQADGGQNIFWLTTITGGDPYKDIERDEVEDEVFIDDIYIYGGDIVQITLQLK